MSLSDEFYVVPRLREFLGQDRRNRLNAADIRRDRRKMKKESSSVGKLARTTRRKKSRVTGRRQLLNPLSDRVTRQLV